MASLKIGWLQFNFENSDWNITRLTNYKDIINEIENYYWWLLIDYSLISNIQIAIFFFWNVPSIIIFIWVINN